MSAVKDAHKHCANHRSELKASSRCGCFYCLRIFAPSQIIDWIDWPPDTPKDRELETGTTALCPYCGIDSVLGDASGYEIDQPFLRRMHLYWFENDLTAAEP
jgi:hypothetical protein